MKTTNYKSIILSVLTGVVSVLGLQFVGLKPELHSAPALLSPTYRVVKWEGDLQPILDTNAKDGWHLHSIAESSVIFEK